MAKTPHGTKGWIEYMEGARKYFAQNGTLNGYDFYKWNNQRWYPDNKSKVIKGQNFNADRRIGGNLYSPKSYESKLKEARFVDSTEGMPGDSEGADIGSIQADTFINSRY